MITSFFWKLYFQKTRPKKQPCSHLNIEYVSLMIMQREWWLVSHAALWNSNKRLLCGAIMFLHTATRYAIFQSLSPHGRWEAQFVQNVKGDNIRWMVMKFFCWHFWFIGLWNFLSYIIVCYWLLIMNFIWNMGNWKCWNPEKNYLVLLLPLHSEQIPYKRVVKNIFWWFLVIFWSELCFLGSRETPHQKFHQNSDRSKIR